MTRESLYELVWSKSTTTISQEYRISTNDLRKLCRYYDVPLPLQGYWSKIKHNKPTVVTELPESNKQTIDEYQLLKRNVGDDDIPFFKSPFLKRVYEVKNDKSYKLTVPTTLKNAHPLIIKTKKSLEAYDKILETDYYERRNHFENTLPIHTDKKLRNRALRIMNTIITNIYDKGHSVSFRNKTTCSVEMFGQQTEINLRQKINRIREKDESGYGGDQWVKSDKLEFQAGPSFSQKNWIDGKKKNLEDYIPNILVWIEQDCQYWHDLRKRQAEEELIRNIEREKEQEKLKIIQLENERFEELLVDSEKWHKATILRNYIQATKKKAEQNNELNEGKKKWIQWASSKADSIDPLINDQL
ncbi:hypothetical protein [Olleya sp. UBA1516]|uniref:hypothetical protein n=1 Tax=Olleya sp. UBA1516 TaxID=1947013 RepID=UPI0025F1CA4A|nr:hypothetical protein [Olleya sp. UBA1516]|tara:strand:+ start:797 stop:1870 length:1074 start_codon:yes stop_codon:yes gene_type:complete